MADDSDLLPCPHCGGPAKSYHRPDDSGWMNTYWICCDAGDDGIKPECGAQTCLHESRAQAVAAWNRRSSPVAAPQQPSPASKADAFRNMFAILHNLEASDLPFMSAEQRWAFFRDPIPAILRLDDARLDALYALVQSKQPARYRH